MAVTDSEKVEAVLAYLQAPRHDSTLGYVPALQDIWRILSDD